MSYQDVLTELSEGSASLVGQMWQLVESGAMPEAVFATECAFVVAAARRRGEAAAIAALRASLEAWSLSGAIVAYSPPTGDLQRLREAVGTILAGDGDQAMRLERLAGNEPLEAANDAFTAAMESSPVVTGWRRSREPDACQLCNWWWREGRVFQPNHRMPRHTGCVCTQEPVRTQTNNYQTEAQARDAAADRRARERTQP